MSAIFAPPATKAELTPTNTHLMADIETLGTCPRSAVLTIGAVLFDPRKQDDVGALERRGLLRRVSMNDALTHGTVDPDTIKWWFEQDDKAIKELVTGEIVSLKTALEELRQYAVHRWVKGDDKFFAGHSQYPIATTIWANSPNFDCTILEHACRQVGEVFPFKFFQYRDVRTLKDLAWPNGPDSIPKFASGTKHNALSDAVSQALIVQAGYKQLGLSTENISFSTF
jgi:exodeoxyribonuclease VIII